MSTNVLFCFLLISCTTLDPQAEGYFSVSAAVLNCCYTRVTKTLQVCLNVAVLLAIVYALKRRFLQIKQILISFV